MTPDPTGLDGAAVSGVIAGAALCGECITRPIGIRGGAWLTRFSASHRR